MTGLIRFLLYTGGALLVTSPVLAQQAQGPAYGPHMWHGGWYGWFFGPIMMIAFIAVAVVVVVLLVRWLGGPGHGGALHSPPGKTPLDILKERFARGEIDKEEFEDRRRVLGE
jgi:putative membrane protein